MNVAGDLAAADRLALARRLVDTVCDPELPMLTIADLGILRGVTEEGGEVVVTITPTYSGCPAMQTIEDDIRRALDDGGIEAVRVKHQIAPAWTTDWMSEAGRRKLLEAGIAPPAETTSDKRRLLGVAPTIACPQCGSSNTERVSEFGSTACKALYRCQSCREPFDYFKCL